MPDRTVKPLGDMVVAVKDKVSEGKDPSMPYIGLENLQSSASSLIDVGWAGASVSTNSVFRRGDILFGKLRPRLRKCVRVGFEGYCSTDILVLRALDGIDAFYAGYLLQSDAVFGEAIRIEEGTRMPRCNWKTLQKLDVYCPGSLEQRRIAEVLSTVDEAIEQTEALIAKTQQIKTGLMHDLFTRGVTTGGVLRPPYELAPQLYKESLIGWIPKEWKVGRFGAESTSAVLGTGVRGFSQTSENIPLIKMGNLDWGGLRLDDVEYIDPTRVNDVCSLKLQYGDLLFNTRNTPELVGKTAPWRGEFQAAITDNNILRVRFVERINSIYLALWMGGGPGRRHIGYLSTGTTSVAAVYWRGLSKLPIPIPARTEQDESERIMTDMERQLEHYYAQATKLRQTKEGLMQDLLTGRVRVGTNSSIDAEEADV